MPLLVDILPLMPVNSSSSYSLWCCFKPCAQMPLLCVSSSPLTLPVSPERPSNAQGLFSILYRGVTSSKLFKDLWSEAVHFRCEKKENTGWVSFSGPMEEWDNSKVPTQQPRRAANANAMGSCCSGSGHRPGEATADSTLQVFSLKTKGLFSGC